MEMNLLDLTNSIILRKINSCDTYCKEEKHSLSEMQGSDISYSKFYMNYLMTNQPCLIKSVTSDWNSQKNWVCDNKPDYNYLKTKYGHAKVPVANCNERYYNAHSKSNMNFKEFLEYWEDYAEKNYPQEMPCLYLKDWHFMNEFPDEVIYRVPNLFASDWMNEYLTSGATKNDDYRFVYMGPKGSWTPLHSDVFSSFSWSVNITGKKKWIFFPPGTEEFLKDKFGSLVFDVDSENLSNSSMYPNYQNLNNKIILVQEVGDAVFVPSGWHHQVWNIEDTISINHNWINACNIKFMWNNLENAFSDVQREIEDCKDMDNWEEHCQVILKCSFGMNFIEFIKFLTFIAERRLENINTGALLPVSGNWKIGRNHMLFDLLNISPILSKLRCLKLSFIYEYIERITDIEKTIDDLLNI